MKESLNTALEVIAEEPGLQAILNLIPYGGSLNELLAGKGQRIIEERRNAFLRLLFTRLEALDEETIRKDYFQTDEGFDLLFKALDEARKTRSEEKRDLIVRILCSAMLDFERGSYSPEEYLYLISDLTVQDLRVARLMYQDRPKLREESWGEWEDKVSATLGIDKPDLHLTLHRLGSTGLLKLVTAGEDDDTGSLWVATHKYGEGSFYVVTPAFDKLMEFLQLRG